MGLFNIVRVPATEGHCETEVQFKWGDLWANQYRIGDRIDSSDGDSGTVTVPGLSSDDDGYYRVDLNDWTIVNVEKISNEEWKELEAAMRI